MSSQYWIALKPHGHQETFRDVFKNTRWPTIYLGGWDGDEKEAAKRDAIIGALLHGTFDVDVTEETDDEKHTIRYILTAPQNVRREWREQHKEGA